MAAHRHRGFTLIELLVALFVTAIMFAFGYRALDQAFRSRREVDQQSARLIAVQQAVRTLEQDFELLQPRPVRNLIGDGYMPAFSAPQGNSIGSAGSTLGGSAFGSSGFGNSAGAASSSFGGASSIGSGTPLVTFTRGGWTNPVGIQRSELQRVSYTLEKGVLMRQYFPVDSSTPPEEPASASALATKTSPVVPVALLPLSAATLVPRLRPVAVEVTIELEDWGVLVRHIEVPG